MIALFEFLEARSKYFTSLAFFAVLLTLTLLISQGENQSLNNAIILLQSSALVLFILSLFPLIIKIRETRAVSLQIFGVLIILVLAGLTSYMWYTYSGIILGVLAIVSIIFGVINVNRLIEYHIALKNKSKKIIRGKWYWILIFIFIVLLNLTLIYQKRWISQFVPLINMDALISSLIGYVFLGYLIGVALLIINEVIDILGN